MVAASFASQIPAAVGVIAASMAIGGFIGQSGAAMRAADDYELRRKATTGGLGGLVAGLVGALLSVTLPV